MAEQSPSVPAEDSRIVEEAWSFIARGYLDYWVPRFRPFVERAIEVFDPPPTGPIAVPGCGPGEEVIRLLEMFPGRTIIATDPSPEMLGLLRSRLRERCSTNALATVGRAESLSSTVRQAAGVFSCFSLQLLAEQARVLADWSLALRLGGVVCAIFWPTPAAGGAYGRITATIEAQTGEHRAEWETETIEALPRLGLSLERDERVARETEHQSPEELFQALVDSGPLQVLLRKRGRDVVDRCRKAWLDNHGLSKRGSLWINTAEARLWVMRKTAEGQHGPH